MATNVPVTKLTAPPPRGRRVPRPRLAARLGLTPCTLVSAPAGFGKTTLIGEWALQAPGQVAWLSLDERDDDPSRFWNCVGAALETLGAPLAEIARQIAHTSSGTSPEPVLAALINRVSQMPSELTLVLDDYHVITSPATNGAILALVEGMPRNMRLVLSVREDPQLPLADLRARGLLTEIRTGDLRFTPTEADEFLNSVMHLGLDEATVGALESRTEGWIAGLQLAATSLHGRADATTFVRDFAGSHRYILDYLIEQVIDRQSPAVREFLLETSVLERMTGDLGDAVTGRTDGRETLEYLERANLFTVPLDDDRRWYRYHQLFAECLRGVQRRRHPERTAELHARAAAWLERAGLAPEAIHHAVAAADHDRAARLIEEHGPSVLWGAGESSTVLGWVRSLPPSTLVSRPALGLLMAWSLFLHGDWEAVESVLAEVAPALADGAEPAVRSMRGEVATIRSAVAYEAGDIATSQELAGQAMDLLGSDNVTVRTVASLQFGLSSFLLDDPAAARRSYEDAVAAGRSAGNLAAAVLALGSLAQLAAREGDLHRVERAYRQARLLGSPAGVAAPLVPTAGLAFVEMADVLREWNDLESAREVATEGVRLCRQHQGMPEVALEGLVTLARVARAAGDTAAAAEALQQAQEALAGLQLRPGDIRPLTAHAMAGLARLALLDGDLGEAVRWAASSGLDPQAPLIRTRFAEYALLARVFLASGRRDAAFALLDRLIDEAPNDSLATEPLVARALGVADSGPGPAALSPLERALAGAEHAGYRRLFIDAGRPMRDLLGALPSHPYAMRLLACFDGGTETVPGFVSGSASDLAEPLSERELAILRSMSGGLSNREIADQLFLSVNTVKWHARNLYAKLGVAGRARAVARARERRLV